MPQTKLTEQGIRNLKAPATGQVDYFDRHLSAFGLRVSSKGAKAFFVMTRTQGKLIRVTLGRYRDPELKRTNGGARYLTLKDARAKAGEVIDLAASGIDPREREKERRDREQEDHDNTFKRLADEFLAKYARVKCRPATIKEYERALFGADTKFLHKRPISKITKRDILSIMDGMQARGAMSAADRTLAYLRKFFNWCAARDYLDHPPTDRLQPLIGLVKRERALSKEEIIWVWRAFEVEESRGSIFAPALKLMLLTGQRVDEVAEMTGSELEDLDGDDPMWAMPKAPPPPANQRTKNGLPHLVPISAQAVAVIKSIKRNSDYLFSTTGDTPISGWSRLKSRLDAWLNAERARAGQGPLAPWQFRDLRRTVSTGMNEWLGVDPHIADACLNHISGQAKQGVAGTYNRALYLDQRRIALTKWAAFVEGLVRG